MPTPPQEALVASPPAARTRGPMDAQGVRATLGKVVKVVSGLGLPWSPTNATQGPEREQEKQRAKEEALRLVIDDNAPGNADEMAQALENLPEVTRRSRVSAARLRELQAQQRRLAQEQSRGRTGDCRPDDDSGEPPR